MIQVLSNPQNAGGGSGEPPLYVVLCGWNDYRAERQDRDQVITVEGGILHEQLDSEVD